MTDHAATLDFLVSAADEPVPDSKSIFSRGDHDVARCEISVDAFQANLESTIAKLRRAFTGLATAGDDLPLTKVEVTFEVTASGKICILGTGVETSGTGGFKLVFERK
ncbi:Pepco domain-containing protein [Actinoplanes sp. CA-030573]|uniref:Pepco domain-containing protein n=1 Tax=Actinoplanes sp. CA-030573 TaxID=3239898 RepID=UPI003D93CC7C